MTISNKYNAGFCVLTITVVGYAQIIWITKETKEYVFPISLQDSTVVESGPGYTNYSYHCTHNTLCLETDQLGQVESGAYNKV